jgi:hypothetical protein
MMLRTLHNASDLDRFFGTTPATEKGYEFWTWNVTSLYRSGALMTVARELAKYKLHLVGVQEVR